MKFCTDSRHRIGVLDAGRLVPGGVEAFGAFENRIDIHDRSTVFL